MQVEKDIRNAIEIVKGNDVDYHQYNSVRIFTNFTLKHFKKYKLDDRNVLLKLRSYDQVSDLVSYGANVTCFSSNRFDKYFLELFLSSIRLSYDDHFKYFTKDYSRKNKMFSYEIYERIRKYLSDDTKYFFDSLYKRIGKKSLVDSKLIDKTELTYNQLRMYIRYVLEPKYYKTNQNLDLRNVEHSFMSECDVLNMYKNGSFDLIDLSYNLDICNNDKDREVFLIKKVEKFSKLLKEHGKIQGFVNCDIALDLPNFKTIETRSMKDPNSNNAECKKDYAYVYSQTNNIDK